MIEQIGKELYQFYSFISYPVRTVSQSKLTFKSAARILITYYLIFFVGMLLFSPFAKLAGIEDIPHKLEQLTNMNKWLVLLVAVFTQPIIEELFFRWPLKHRRPLIILLLTMTSMVIFLVLVQWLSQDQATLIACGFFVATTIIFLVKFRSEAAVAVLNNWVNKYFPHIFYAVVVYFAFVHFFNFELNGSLWLYAPILVFPQFLIALYLGYARIHYGFLAAVLIHMLNNLVPTLVLIFVDPETLMGLIG